VLSDVIAGLVPASFKNLAKVFLKLNPPFGPPYDLRTIVRIGKYLAKSSLIAVFRTNFNQ